MLALDVVDPMLQELPFVGINFNDAFVSTTFFMLQ